MARTQELLHSIQDAVGGGHLWERFRTSDPVVALFDYRDDVERKVEETVQRLLGSLQIVTRQDLERIEGELASLRKKVDNLTRVVSASRAKN